MRFSVAGSATGCCASSSNIRVSSSSRRSDAGSATGRCAISASAPCSSWSASASPEMLHGRAQHVDPVAELGEADRERVDLRAKLGIAGWTLADRFDDGLEILDLTDEVRVARRALAELLDDLLEILDLGDELGIARRALRQRLDDLAQPLEVLTGRIDGHPLREGLELAADALPKLVGAALQRGRSFAGDVVRPLECGVRGLCGFGESLLQLADCCDQLLERRLGAVVRGERIDSLGDRVEGGAKLVVAVAGRGRLERSERLFDGFEPMREIWLDRDRQRGGRGGGTLERLEPGHGAGEREPDGRRDGRTRVRPLLGERARELEPGDRP